MNPDFSCTNAVARLAKTECPSCRSVEILKYQACEEGCLGSSRKERLLAAQKIQIEIGAALDDILETKFRGVHESPVEAIETLRNSVLRYGEEVASCLKEIPSYQVPPKKSLSKEAASCSIAHKLTCLEEKLNRMEDTLNIRAAEVYDIKEQISGIPLEFPTVDITTELNEIAADIKKQNKKLEEQKLHNDGGKLDMYKLKKEKPPSYTQSHTFKREMENDKRDLHKSNKGLLGQLDKLENNTNDSTGKVVEFSGKTRELLEITQMMKKQADDIQILSVPDLLEITHNIFSSYSHMKKCHELTKSYIVEQIDRANVYPSIQYKIRTFWDQLGGFI